MWDNSWSPSEVVYPTDVYDYHLYSNMNLAGPCTHPLMEHIQYSYVRR